MCDQQAETYHELRLTLADGDDFESFLFELEQFLRMMHVTANGVLLANYDLATGEALVKVKIINNTPILEAGQEVQHDD